MGSPKLLHALNKGGYLPSYDTGRRRVAKAPKVFPNELPTRVPLFDSVKHVEDVHLWHLLIDELHVEDIITISLVARAISMCATCCIKAVVTLCSGEDVEALGECLDRDAARYDVATQSTVVFLAPHATEACVAIPVCVGSSRLSIAAPYGRSVYLLCVYRCLNFIGTN